MLLHLPEQCLLRCLCSSILIFYDLVPQSVSTVPEILLRIIGVDSLAVVSMKPTNQTKGSNRLILGDVGDSGVTRGLSRALTMVLACPNLDLCGPGRYDGLRDACRAAC